MTQRPKKLTPEEHAELAGWIRGAKYELEQVLFSLQRAYGVSDRAIRPVEKMIKLGGLISILLCRMDDHFYHDGHSGHSPYYADSSTDKPKFDPRRQLHPPCTCDRCLGIEYKEPSNA